MKTLLTILLLAALNCSAQNNITVHSRINQNPSQTTWQVLNSSNQVVQSGNCGSVNKGHTSTSFILPNGNYMFRVNDSACNGFSNGFVTLSVCDVAKASIISGSYCFMQEEFTVASCPQNCPAHLNGDGIVGNADLLIFQQLFGTTCNPLKK